MNRELKKLELSLVIQHKETPSNKITKYLNSNETTELLQLIGQNIREYYPSIEEFGLIGIGSIYHLHQIIRPNFPIYTQLFKLSKIRFRPNHFIPSIIGIGTEQEQFEIELFNRDETIFSEVLQILPLLIIFPDDDKSLSFMTELEEHLINEVHSNQVLKEMIEKHFNIEIENISISTLSDLNILFASQLIQIGLEELWHIMKSVIFNLNEEIVTLGSGHILYWKLDEVVIFTPHPSIFNEALNDYHQSYETYLSTTQRLEYLFKSHKIPYSKSTLFNPQFFKETPSFEQAKNAISNHIKAL